MLNGLEGRISRMIGSFFLILKKLNVIKVGEAVPA
jgi:hypothetical protein